MVTVSCVYPRKSNLLQRTEQQLTISSCFYLKNEHAIIIGLSDGSIALCSLLSEPYVRIYYVVLIYSLDRLNGFLLDLGLQFQLYL